MRFPVRNSNVRSTTMNRLLCSALFITAGAYGQNGGDSALDQSRPPSVLNDVVHNTVRNETGDLYRLKSSRSGSSAWDSVAPNGTEPTQGLTLVYPTYISVTAYSINTYVTASDMNIYRSLGPTTGNDPTTDRGRNWELATVNVNTTLNVPSRFTTFGAASRALDAKFFSSTKNLRGKSPVAEALPTRQLPAGHFCARPRSNAIGSASAS